MTKGKSIHNRYYILVGAFFIIGFFYIKGESIRDNDLTEATITLKMNIEYRARGAGYESYHRIWANETKAAFKIEVPGGIAANWAPLDSLKQGDTLTIEYYSTHKDDLADASKEIPIYFLQKSGRTYFDPETYNQANIGYNNRWRWIFLCMGILSVVRGVAIFPKKVIYMLAAACAQQLFY